MPKHVEGVSIIPKHVAGWLSNAEICSRIYYEMIQCIFVSVCSVTYDEIVNNMSIARNMNNIIL